MYAVLNAVEMGNQITSVKAAKVTEPELREPDIFQRLAQRGVRNKEYSRIKTIVTFNLPGPAIFFVRQFGSRSIGQVLNQITAWKAFLEKDFLLSAEQKDQVRGWLRAAELLAWRALLEANRVRVGPWKLRWKLMPTGTNDRGRPVYLKPSVRIVAKQVNTNKTRKVIIPAENLIPAKWGETHQKALEKLGLWHLVWKGSPKKGLASKHSPRAWPVFTKHVIPELYEYLNPRYSKRGHHSERIDSAIVDRNALFPRELLQDMLDILRVEHPAFFQEMTLGQLKAIIQRYLDRNRKSTHSAK